jgi:hypothetical protein
MGIRAFAWSTMFHDVGRMHHNVQHGSNLCEIVPCCAAKCTKGILVVT